MNGRRVLGLLLLVALAAATTGWPPLLNIAYLLSGVLAVGWLWARASLLGLELRREPTGGRMQVGDTFVQRVELRGRGPLPRLGLAVVDLTTLPGHEPGRVVDLPPFAHVGWTIRTRCTRRGEHRLGPVELVASDPLACFAARRRLPAAGAVLVLPPTEPLPGFRLPGGEALAGGPAHPAGALGAVHAASVRALGPGDPVRRIHWRSTARAGQLMVRELEPEPSADVWLALDLQAAAHDGVGADATEERAVAVAASVARRCLDDGCAVALVAWGDRPVLLPPDRGERQLLRLLETLAVVRARGARPFAELLRWDAVRPGRGAVLVAITPSRDPGWARALDAARGRGVRPLAILVDPAPGGPVPARLAGGVPLRVVRRGEPLGTALAAR
ncbi:MAG TPA: DUF58 domain-containing protein [Chloroflexota bacterium]|nr:DUF58 domain-containing protein [Chloroflexota bacterium]